MYGSTVLPGSMNLLLPGHDKVQDPTVIRDRSRSVFIRHLSDGFTFVYAYLRSELLTIEVYVMLSPWTDSDEVEICGDLRK